MICVYKEIDNIYRNLATEEFLLKTKTDDVIFLWRSEPSVVVGKHQNTLGEVNFRYLHNKNIKIARRLSGGGAVYHDEGNLNFTFIRNAESGKLVDFKRFVGPVVAFLKRKGLDAHIGSKHDILIENLKISGNAEHIFKNRVLHHGTLLYSSTIEILNESIKAIPGRYIDKAVQSNRSIVANISEFLSENQSIEEFAKELFNYLVKEQGCSTPYLFSKDELNSIERLAKEKYASWNWIYGYSPAFEIQRIITFEGSDIPLSLKVVKGIVSTITRKPYTGAQPPDGFEKIVKFLQGCRFDYTEIEEALHKSDLNVVTIEKILTELF